MTYRQRANAILALSFLCFVLVFWWWYSHEVGILGELLFFVIQSALIGSIADWFAVTALFERPLGFPYHTELVYSHRTQIIDGMTHVVSEKLLQPGMWKDKLYTVSFVDKFTNWLTSGGGREKFRALLYEVAQQAYEYGRQSKNQQYIAAHIRAYLKRQPLLSFLQDRMITMLEDPDSQMLTDIIGLIKDCVRSKEFEAVLVKALDEWMAESRTAPHLIMTLNKFTGMVDTKKVAKDVQKGIIVWLERWEHAGGKERQWLCQKLELQMYAMNGQLTYTVQRWQDQFVDSLPVEMWLTSTQRASQAYFTTGVEGKDKLQNLLEGEFMHYIDYCSQYPEIKDWIDDQIRRGCEVILEHEHSLIGVAVREVLSGFDKKKFNAFLESKVGEDLAWIRINGAIVGGTLGLFVFVILKVIYEPFFVPFIRNLFM